MRLRQRSPKSIGLLVLLFTIALVLAACGSQAGSSVFSNVGDELVDAPAAGGDGDLQVRVTGPAGFLTDTVSVFEDIDTALSMIDARLSEIA